MHLIIFKNIENMFKKYNKNKTKDYTHYSKLHGAERLTALI